MAASIKFLFKIYKFHTEFQFTERIKSSYITIISNCIARIICGTTICCLNPCSSDFHYSGNTSLTFSPVWLSENSYTSTFNTKIIHPWKLLGVVNFFIFVIKGINVIHLNLPLDLSMKISLKNERKTFPLKNG